MNKIITPTLTPTLTVSDIRWKFIELYRDGKFTENKNKTGSKTVELIGSSFIADEDCIFGEPNKDWYKREEEWYESQSLNVNDIPGGPPKIWTGVATPEGFINSNYGYLTKSKENHSQFDNCLQQLIDDKSTRRALMIYTRPSIQTEYNRDGMSDFICTNFVQYLIRNNELISIVAMRSSDGIFGYRGDLHWQKNIRDQLYAKLLNTYPELTIGPIIWQASSLHIYERHFNLIGKWLDNVDYLI